MGDWRRPHAYLRADVRRASSVWARVGPAAEQRAVRKLGDDLCSGRWAERNREIASLTEIDRGARLLSRERGTSVSQGAGE